MFPGRYLAFCISLTALVSGTVVPCTRANCPVPAPRANTEFFKADLVFLGRVASERTRFLDREKNYAEGWFYRLRVSKVFRGQAVETVTVYTRDDSNRFPLEIGSEYLLFAYWRGKRLEIDHCGSSSLQAEAGSSIRRLEQIPQWGRMGEIEGWVAPRTSGVDVSGVPIVIRGRSKTYTALSNEQGRFSLRVPAGPYRMDFHSREYYINGDDAFWDDPGHFYVRPGGCAVLQVVSVR